MELFWLSNADYWDNVVEYAYHYIDEDFTAERIPDDLGMIRKGEDWFLSSFTDEEFSEFVNAVVRLFTEITKNGTVK